MVSLGNQHFLLTLHVIYNRIYRSIIGSSKHIMYWKRMKPVFLGIIAAVIFTSAAVEEDYDVAPLPVQAAMFLKLLVEGCQ